MKSRQCPKCQKNVACSWFFFSAHWTKYRCVACGSLMRWSGRRTYIGAISGGFAGPFVISTQSMIPSTFIRISIAIVFAMVLAVSVNKQIEYIDETEL
ncbi:hypothetical protein [Vibrio gallaecicus]|uniref:Uncharacterized protein n=1 Tax=Vibrio gallaecicus TaxID=552386 RepID=A0ABV4NH57_9VIBR